MNNVCAVVVTYNRLELLKECINALDKQTYQCDVLIVDNCSTDGTFKFLEDNYKDNKRINFIQTESNIGGAGGFNLGMKKAVEQGYDYIWIMDDDCICEEEALNELMKTGLELGGQYGFLSSKALWIDGKMNVMNIPRVSLWKEIDNYNTNSLRIKLASFVSLFIKKDTIVKEGLPISDFFLWGDDWEYTDRISKAHPCYYVGSSIVLHKTNNNSGASIANDTIDRVLNRYKYIYRNESVLAKNNGLIGRLYQFLKVNYHIFKVLLLSKDNKFARIKIIIKSSLEGIKYNPPVEYIQEQGQQ